MLECLYAPLAVRVTSRVGAGQRRVWVNEAENKDVGHDDAEDDCDEDEDERYEKRQHGLQARITIVL